MKPLFFFLSLLFLFLTGCATNPVTGKSELQLVSEEQEIAMGTKQYPYQIQLAGGEYLLDPDLSAYVREIGLKLAEHSDRPHLPYDFTIVNDSSWNAWAMPGGKIAIHRGLLEALRSESELAAVLAHEIVHAAARHSAQQIERNMWMQAGVAGLTLAVEADLQDVVYQTGSLAAGITQLSYSRGAESEADYHGIHYMLQAGYDGSGAVTLQEMFAENQDSSGGWLASHPTSIERVRRNRESLQGQKQDGYQGAAEYRVHTRALTERAPAYELYDQGVKALTEDRAREALRLSMLARKELPQEALFYGLSAQSYEKLNNPDAALQAWDQAIQRNSEWFLFWLKRAQIHEKRGNKTKAAADYRRSFDLLPTETAKTGFQRNFQ
ncbi:MAG: M48 family metalloprotease [Kiritimatiellia bacterium]